MSENKYTDEQREQWGRFIAKLNPNHDPHVMHMMRQMRQVAHAIYRASESEMEDVGISQSQFRVLMQLLFSEEMCGRTGLNPSEISDWHGVNRNTVSSLLRSLEDRGFVEREVDEQDRRKFVICLTTAGRAFVRLHSQDHINVASQLFGSLDAEEQLWFGRIMDKLTQQIGMRS